AVGHNQRTCTTRCVLPELPPERLSVVVWEAPHCSRGLLPGVGRRVSRHATYLLPAGRTTIRPARAGDDSRWLEGKRAFKMPIPFSRAIASAISDAPGSIPPPCG